MPTLVAGSFQEFGDFARKVVHGQMVVDLGQEVVGDHWVEEEE